MKAKDKLQQGDTINLCLRILKESDDFSQIVPTHFFTKNVLFFLAITVPTNILMFCFLLKYLS